MSMSTSLTRPPWVESLQGVIGGKEKDQSYTTYALSTLSPEGLPKVRHVIHRFLSPTSSILVTTTDTRMQKPVHLNSNSTIEAAWWIVEPAIQFRITGQAVVLPSDPSSSTYSSEVEKALKKLGAKGDELKPEFWEDKRKDLWKNAMSGHLRASFARPPPGKLLEECPDSKEWPERLDSESKDPKENKVIEEALEHFALLAIKTEGFECLELKPSPNVRTQWYEKEDGQWEERKVAP